MASRRIKSTVNNNYTQPLKLRMGRKLVLTPNCSYNSVLYTVKHRGFQKSDEKINSWAKFNTNTFDGIQLIAWLENTESNITPSANCVFKIYYVDVNNNWSQSLIHTVNGTLNGNQWTAAPTQADLGLSNELDGERTLMIEVSLTKWNRVFNKRFYVNHLGVYDSIVRLRQEVDFLNITKKDL